MINTLKLFWKKVFNDILISWHYMLIKIREINWGWWINPDFKLSQTWDNAEPAFSRSYNNSHRNKIIIRNNHKLKKFKQKNLVPEVWSNKRHVHFVQKGDKEDTYIYIYSSVLCCWLVLRLLIYTHSHLYRHSLRRSFQIVFAMFELVAYTYTELSLCIST